MRCSPRHACQDEGAPPPPRARAHKSVHLDTRPTRRVRRFPGQGVVRLNSTAILREDNLYRKKQESEAHLLGAYERELRDSSEFDAWRSRMRMQDEDERLHQIEERRVATILADEQAKEARIRQENENRVVAMALKAEAANALEEKAGKEEERQAQQRALVMDVQAQREKPVQAKYELAKQHRKQARELREEISRSEAAAAAERRGDDARRADLIKQIRALELVPRKRETRLDPTYTPQLGLFEEMSLAELRERLLIVEEQQKEDEEQKRASIITSKQEREAKLAQRVERLSEMRGRAATEAASKREKTKAVTRAAEEQARERLADAQVKVQATLDSKRAERRQKEGELAAELKKLRMKNQFLGADKEAVERKKWESHQAGEQREIIQRQQLAQQDAQGHLAVYNTETQQRRLNLRLEREAHESFLHEYEAHFSATSDQACTLEGTIVTEQAEKLRTRTALKRSKAFPTGPATSTLPSLRATRPGTN